MFNSNIWPNSAPLQDIRLWNLSDFEFDLSRSLKVKCDSVIWLPIYAFLLMFNGNIWPNSAPLQDIRLWNLSDLEFDLSRSLRSNMMMSLESPYMVSYWHIQQSHVELSPLITTHITTHNVFSYLLSLGPKYEKSQVHRMTPKWPWRLKGQRYPYMLYKYPRATNFTPFCSTIARFPDNWGFWFLHRLQCWIWYFRKKIIKNQKLKISKIPNVVLWGPLGGKFRKSFKTFGCNL